MLCVVVALLAIGAGSAARADTAALPAVGQPTELAALASRFEEPLVPTAPATSEDDEALGRAITLYINRTTVDDFGALEAFLAAHPHSAWRLSLLTNLGLSYYHYGYFSRAIAAFEAAWAEGRSATELHARALADRAAGELLKMHARLGHSERLTALLAEMADRNLTGQATELRDGALQGLWIMRHESGVAYLCGPMALKSLLLAEGASTSDIGFLDKYRSGPHGVTLAEVARLADQAKLSHRLIRRTSTEPVPVPSIIHWKENHYAAIVGERDGRYQLQDPTFGESLWVTRTAIDAEGSGYFLVPTSENRPEWKDVGRAEAEHVFGMGSTSSSYPQETTPSAVKACGCATPNPTNSPTPLNSSPVPSPAGDLSVKTGMAVYNFTEMLVSLNISDSPVGYAPPRGPAIPITITYNQREASQPANFSFFNVSPKWSLNWLTYIEDDPTMTGANVTRVVGGGGSVLYTGYSTTSKTFAPEIQDASVLSLVSANPVTYQRALPDGSFEIYSASNRATSYPRLIFLTQIIDARGNKVSLTYDSLLRLSSIVDATARSTAFTYGSKTSPLLVTGISDPFGRTAQFAYDSSGRLSQITDVLGLTSRFSYDSSSLVNAMTTPYGTTQFTYGQDTDDNNLRYLTATDPLGHTERLEFNQGRSGVNPSDPPNTVPVGLVAPYNGYLDQRDTFYWDRHAYTVAAGNYAAARNRHWAHLSANGTWTPVTSNQVESIKYPLESRIWFSYPGQATETLGAGESGSLNQPTGIGRVLDGGRTQLTQLQYNAAGNPVSVVDPFGRQTLLQYATNQIDVKAVQQVTASGPATVAAFTYSTAHLPLTYTDAAGKTTQYTYNTAGQLTKTIDALGESTVFTPNSLGYLTSITNANGKTAASFTYDSYGRVLTATDSEGWTVQYAYDAMDRVTQETYPDKTFRKYTYTNLDLVAVQDRQGRTTKYTYDAERNLTSVTDPLGQVTTFGYDESGRLTSLTDPNGHVTAWARDVEGRVTAKQYADGTVMGQGYDSANHLLFTSDPLNQIKQFSYTTDNRVYAIQYFNTVNPTPLKSFTYDPYFPRMTSMTDGSGTTQYSYQPIGALGALRLASEQPPYANSTLTYQYDALGRVSGRGVGGNTESIGYDTLGRVVSHKDDLGTFIRTYLGQTGQITSQSNGTVGTTWTYDTNTNDRRLIGITNSPSASQYSFTTTPENDITAIVDAFNKQTWSYGYDNADRLLGATSTTGAKYGYGYDFAGNLGTIQRPAGTTTIVPNALNQISKAGASPFTYDANGNLIQDYARTYQWDADNQLIAIGYLNNPGTTTTFRYDGLGRRIAIGSTSGNISGETRYNWCGGTLCQARTGSDAVLKHYFAEGEETPSENVQLYYGVDQLGTVHDALAPATGALVAHYDYEPYGSPTGLQQATVTDFRYAGLFDHQTSGLYLAAYRAYDPVVGRWITRDPIREGGGTNLYAYANGNSLSLFDPLGLYYAERWAVSGAIAGGGITIGGSLFFDAATGGLNIAATPAEVGAGSAIGGRIGYILGSVTDALTGKQTSASDIPCHGNSLLSTRQTHVYELRSLETDDLLKYGITSNEDPEDRYSSSYYANNGAYMVIIATYDNRATARIHEFGLCSGYTIWNGRLPPLSGRC